MPDARILIVEDDAIIGLLIQVSLKRLGYEVAGVLFSGEDAVSQIAALNPDLVLMDIALAGDMDGIQAAGAIRTMYNLPVVFLTAFADQSTFQRAKIADPFGYLLKPFDERILHSTIEMALYKHHMERRLVESEELLRTLVDNQGEGVAIISPEGRFVFVNPAIEAIFNVARGGLIGCHINDFFLDDQLDHRISQNRMVEPGVKTVFETEFSRPTCEKRTLLVTMTPWIDKNGSFAGTFAIISDITERKQMEGSERQARLLAETLYATVAALNSSLEMEEVFDLILTNVGRLVSNEFAIVMIIEGEQARIVHNHLERNQNNGKRITAPIIWRENEVLRKMAELRQPLLISDLSASDLLASVPSMSWIKSYLGAPLRIQNKTIGFIHLGSSVLDFFKPYHAQQLDVFALQASLAIENAQLFMETRKRAHFLGLLNEITRLAISAVDEDATMSAVAEKMSLLFQADGVFVTVWDEEQQLAIPAVGYGYTSETYANIPCQPGKLTLTASVLRSGHALAVDDIHHTIYIDKDLASTFPLSSMMGLPLIADGIRLGAVIIGFKDPHHFTQEEIDNGEQVSSQVALAFAKARLYSQVQRMAVTDELTRLYNRRGIFDKGRVLFAETQKKNLSMALIWMDIDHFKAVNDTYGHHIGDQVVRGVADCCRSCMRDQDLIGRYGGEGGDELISLLPDTDLAAARQVAERVRQRVSVHPIETDKGQIVVTVSLGVSVISCHDTDLSGLLNRADQAMYAAKSAGRNCVIVVEA